MKLESRILSSINHRPGPVFLRRDVRDLGSASQVTEVLKTLQEKGLIVRISNGAYAKSRKDIVTGEIKLAAEPKEIASELFRKLGVKAHVSEEFSTSTIGELTVETASSRVRRNLCIAGKSVIYTSPSHINTGVKLRIPTEGIRAFVMKLAKKHHISFARTKMDDWADTVTRLAGDSVTADLLVALKRARKLSDRDMAMLLIKHEREKRRV